MSQAATLNDPGLRESDPEVARLVERELERQSATLSLIPSENYVSRRCSRRSGSVFTNKYSEGYPGSATTRASRSSTSSSRWRSRAPRALRRRARKRAAVLGLAGEPRGLPRLAAAGRHGDGHGAADGRPPHPRLERVDHRQVVPRRCSTACGGTRAASTSTRCAARATERPKLIFCGGTAIPRHDRLRRLRRDRRRGRRAAGGRHRAHRRPDRRRRAPLAGRSRRRGLDDHTQDAARPARRRC